MRTEKTLAAALCAAGLLFAGPGLADDDFTWAEGWQQTSSGSDEFKVDVHYHVTAEFLDYRAGAGGNSGNSTFNPLAFEPFIGIQLNKHVYSKFTPVFMVGGTPLDGSNAGGAPDIDQANPLIVQAQIDVTPPVLGGMTFLEATTLSFGKFIIPYGFENYLHAPPDNFFVTRPAAFAVSTVAGTPPGQGGGTLLPGPIWSDAGAWWQQRFASIGLTSDVYVINGSAAGEVNNDIFGGGTGTANNAKSVGGRLAMAPSFLPGLTLMASGITGRYTANTATDRSSRRWGLGAEYKRDRLYFLGEYLTGEDEGASLAGGARDREVEGWYATAAYEVIPTIWLAGRYGDFDSDELENAGTGTVITGGREASAGLRWEPWRGFYVKGEYQWNREEDRSINNDLLALQIGFFH